MHETIGSPTPAGTQASRPDFRYVLFFDQIGIDDVERVGGKNASLGEMFRELTPMGIRVPAGFAVTAEAFRYFLEANGLTERIHRRLASLDPERLEDLQAGGLECRQAVLEARFPPELEREILAAYEQLGGAGRAADVAVRSSATAEDLPGASFAGQQETYLNVQGNSALLASCKRCFASLFTDRAISYRVHQGFDHAKVALSIGVQRMVRSDLAASGVMFTLDTESGFRDVVLLNAAYGLGETVVQGSVNPDEFTVFKPTLKSGHRPILRRKIGGKEFKLVYDAGGSRMVRNAPVSPEERNRFCITDDEVVELARWAMLIEEHYAARRGSAAPMDIEWAKDGLTGELHIVQARPETVHGRKSPQDAVETYRLKEKGQVVLATGRSVGEKIAQGPARLVRDLSEAERIRPGDVLVTAKTDPDWEPIMKRAAAIVTDRGGRTCHAAIVSRELGLAAIVGTGNGTSSISDGGAVTVSCAEGDTGRVYEGSLAFERTRVELGAIPRTRTAIMLNVGNPDEAFRLSFLPNDGVGLAREEFIISTSIRIHPLALLAYPNLSDKRAVAEIARITAGYGDKDKPQFFVDRLAEGAAMIAAAFYPKDVILRLSDFKTNEYAGLIGGEAFEPKEENPMLGFRGASRYYHPRYQAAFALECRAVRKVREEMGLTNLKIMIPFCRTLEEGRRVHEELAKNGLVRGENGLEVYVMCEIPSNVILAEEFAEIFDGFSIGSNDLTQLVLGVDRDSEIVAPVFDERNPAVLAMLAQVIRAARARKRKIGICGQAPSDYPEIVRFLVEQGIDSLSLNPDVAVRTTLAVAEAEEKLAADGR